MTDEEDSANQSLVDRLIGVLLGLLWPKVLKQAWELIRKVVPGPDDGDVGVELNSCQAHSS
jgi:hypothetical protein